MRPFILGLLLALAACRSDATAPAEAAKPDLALLSSLPILFGEQFTLEPPASRLRDALGRTYALRAVDGPDQLRSGGLLLAVQPRALTAERLAALDEWVRRGGRIVLLADPRLEWDSSRPLGDRLRPPYEFPDTGLLAHWGLTLVPPVVRNDGSGGERHSAGRFETTGPQCQLKTPSLADCRIGRGRALVMADADVAMSETDQEVAQVVALVDALRSR